MRRSKHGEDAGITEAFVKVRECGYDLGLFMTSSG